MPSIDDWAAKAAKKIRSEITVSFRTTQKIYKEPPNLRTFGSEVKIGITEERIAAIIATFADPLIALLREAKRDHEFEGESRCCEHLRWEDRLCTCGADDWNARIDAALAGKEKPVSA